MTRARLPNRRPSLVQEITYRGQPISVTIGFDGIVPREVFANGARDGSDMQHILSDACVMISIALQHGVAASELAHSLGTVPAVVDGEEMDVPASPIGAIIGCLVEAV